MLWRRRILILLLSLGIIAALVYGFMPKPVPVSLVEVRRGTLQVTVEEEGKTRVKDRFVISAPVAGYVRRVELDVGDSIKKGQVLVTMEPQRSRVLDPRSRAEARARVEAAGAALNVSKENILAASAEAEYASSEFQRIKKLFDKEVVSRDAMEEVRAKARYARATLKSSEFAMEVARFELKAARTALKYSASAEAGLKERVAIRAPIDGSVLKIYQESEGAVTEGQEIISIGDPSSIEVEVDVLSADAVRIKPGTEVRFHRWGGEVPLKGRVRIVEPAGFTKISALGVEEQRVLVISDITSEPGVWERLGDGYRVEADFILWEGADILQVPTSALFRSGKDWATFVVEDKRARERPVRIGHRSGLSTEILSGVKEGESVITHPDDSVEDGVRVRPR
ncbi:MAG: efflux RND transporter periplasmic adaptor subunit [Thermodesulfobacteriota bacterium]